MALAKKFTRTVTEIVPATTRVVEVPHIELNLTMEEAQVLFDICGRIGGSSVESPRKHTHQIFKALMSQGVSSLILPTVMDKSYIYYKDTVKV